MCGFGMTNKKDANLLLSNKYCERRGPDHTNLETINGVHFLHNLLHLTGEKTIQPFKKGNFACLFNGEIYNYLDFGNYSTDGLVIIDLYEKYGMDFLKKLDGEYAIVLIDFNLNQLLIANDCFSTKPLWFSFENNEFGCASYKSQLIEIGFNSVDKLKSNHAVLIDLNNFNILRNMEIYKFDILQHKNNCKDWISAFEKSIKKRTYNTQYNIFLGMSSGYDSGAIIS